MLRLSLRAGIVVAALLVVLAPRALSQGVEEIAGAEVYGSVCAACHQGSGAGVPGAFPPLADHVEDLLAADGGRTYVISAVLFGLQGEITVDGTVYNGLMPAQGSLSDAEIAAVLNYVVTGLGDEPAPEGLEEVTPEEVADVRSQERTPSEVHALRPQPAPEPEDDAASKDLLLPTFTAAQADRGDTTYQQRCTECHGSDLGGGVVGGPPLRGSYFDQRWSGRTVGALFEYTRARMPQDRPGSLTDQAYADIVALMLRVNGLRAGGGELPADAEELQRFVIPE